MKKRESRIGLFIVLAAAFLFYAPGLIPGRILLPADVLCNVLPWHNLDECSRVTTANPIISDEVFQFFAWRAVVKTEGWRAVFWNPYAFAGSPLAGNAQSALFYPLNWVHFILPGSSSYALLAILRTAIAATFIYLLAAKRVSAAAAALAAAAYVFSYTFVFSIGFPLGDALTWLPVLFWAVETGSPIVLSAATALELLSGQPQTSAAVFMSLAGFALWRLRSRRDIVRAGVAVLAGFLIAAPQLVLVYRYLDQSAAAALRSEFQPLFYSAHTLLEFFTPAFFGTSAPQHRWASNVGGYFGLIAFLLAVSWILARPREALRNAFVWIFAGSLALIYAVPPFVWILKVPYLDAIFPPKFWATATFSGAMVAATGLEAYRTGALKFRILSGVGILFVAVMTVARWHFREFISALSLVSFENQVLVVVAGTVVVSLILLRKLPELAVLVLIAESFYYLGSYNTAASTAILEARPPVVEFLKKDPQQFRIAGDGVFPANMAGTFGLQDVRGYDALTPRKYFDYMSAIDSSFPDLFARIHPPESITNETLSYRDTVARPTAYWGPAFTDYLKRVFYWNEQITRLERPQLFDLLNVKYYLVARGARLPAGAENYRLVYFKEVDVYENPGALPRAFVVPSWKLVADEKAALAAIRNASFDPRRTAIICCAPGDRGVQSVNGAFREAEIQKYEANEVVVRATGPGLLVLADSYFPGWRADGFDIFEANYLFRGVLLKEGPQTVTFSFHPFGGSE
jgi:hypothetical protein